MTEISQLLPASLHHRYPLLPSVVIFLLLNPTSAQVPQTQTYVNNICTSPFNFSVNSTYEANLSRLLPSLAANAAAMGGFHNTSTGLDPDRVYGLALCRGDVNSESCGACLATASAEAVKRCPMRRAAVIWYELCLLRYSDLYFFSSANTSLLAWQPNGEDSVNPFVFNQELSSLLYRLVSESVADSSGRLFATGGVAFNSFENISALVQCTRDLSPEDCRTCLWFTISRIPSCCDGKKGGRFLTASCFLRYELYLFFRASPIQTPAPPPPPALVMLPPPSTPPSGKKRRSPGPVTLIFVPVVSAALLMLAALLCLRLLRKRPREMVQGASQCPDVECLQFDLSAVRASTNNFSEAGELGAGGFGVVYKGTLPDGQEIAVKRLSMHSGQGAQEFKTEVALIAKLQHRNLVRLIGWCVEGDEKILIYEFVSNSSLNKFLFDESKKAQLNWRRRYKIIEGIARGLLYLHEDSRLRIVHLDLKAGNVLLDAGMNAKISDFGMAKIFGADQTQGCTNRIAGTYGYMAPEYAMRGHFSVKADVFSFGILLLEIITGKKNKSTPGSEPTQDLPSHAWWHWNNGTTTEIVDPTIRGECPTREVTRCIHIALLCVQEDARDRPPMSYVVLMLSSYFMDLPAPSPSAFVHSNGIERDPVTEGNDSGVTPSEPSAAYQSVVASVNEVFSH